MRYKEDIRTLIFSFLCFTSFILQWSYRNIYQESIGTILLYLSFTSLQAFQQAVTVHNFAHCPVFSNKFFNNTFGLFLTFLSGAPSSLYVPGHNESHHRHLETVNDVMRTYRMKYKYECLNILLFFPTILLDIQKNDMYYMSKQRKLGTPLFFQFVVEITCYNLFLISLFYFDFYKAFFIYFLPTFIGKYMIVTLNILQHKNCDPNSKYNHSRNFTGPLLNYLLLNNGYHTQHHNAPGMHWSLLKKKHDTIKHNIEDQLLQPNIFYYLFKELLVVNSKEKSY